MAWLVLAALYWFDNDHIDSVLINFTVVRYTLIFQAVFLLESGRCIFSADLGWRALGMGLFSCKGCPKNEHNREQDQKISGCLRYSWCQYSVREDSHSISNLVHAIA